MTVEKRLGHSTIGITADRYGHLFPSVEQDLTDSAGRMNASTRTIPDVRQV